MPPNHMDHPDPWESARNAGHKHFAAKRFYLVQKKGFEQDKTDCYGLHVAARLTRQRRAPATSPVHDTRHCNRVRTNVTVSRSNPNMVATSGHYSQIMTPGIATLLGPRILTKLQQVGPQMAPGALRHLTNRPPRPLGSGTCPSPSGHGSKIYRLCSSMLHPLSC